MAEGDRMKGEARPAPASLSASRPSLPVDFESLFARSPNPYVLLDDELTLVWMNEAYLRATMRTREELVGKRMFDAFPSDPGSESFRLLDTSLRRVFREGETDELALIRYDIRDTSGAMDVRYWSATHNPVRDATGRVQFVLQHTVDVTELHSLRTMRDEMGLLQRAQAVQAHNRNLAQESQQMRALFEQAPGFIAILSGAEHRFMLANEAYRTLVGGRYVIGETVADALPEVVEQGFVQLLDQVHASGTPYVGNREKVHLRQSSTDATEERYLNFIYQPIFTEGGQVSGVFVQGHDVTEQVEAEERQKLLINELNHRVKNTLAIVQSLAMQSFRRIENSEGAQKTFNDRLNALAAAHSLLTERNWETARLAEMLRRAVDAAAGQDAERVRLAGPDLILSPQMAVALAMVVHELSTNAIKYGALSDRSGTVDIEWSLDSLRALTILWTEQGGPPVVEPERRGFGTRLIERGLPSNSGSEVLMDFLPAGLRCTIRVKLPEAAA